MSLAVQGYGPADELDSLRLFARDNPDYRPDLVLVNYFVGNDLTDTLFRLRGGLPKVGLLRYRGGEWLQRSYLLRFLGGWWEERRINADARRIRRTRMLLAPPLPAAKQALNPYLVDVAHVLPDYLAINLLVEGRLAQLSWEENQRLLRKIHDYSGKMIINILPHTLQVNDSHYSFLKELGFRVDPRMLTSTEPQDRLKIFCAAEGIVCNDLLPEFRQRASQEFYLPADDHWLTPGHTLAADVIEAKVAPLLP